MAGTGSSGSAEQDDLPVSTSEKKPLESISVAAKDKAMELEEIMDEGMLNTPVSWEMESPSLLPIRELFMESFPCLLRLQSEPFWLDINWLLEI